MSALSQTHLRQGRSFLRAGDPQRAVELLEKARALARDDKPILREVLVALGDAYAANGQHDRAQRCREQAQCLAPPPPQTPPALPPDVFAGGSSGPAAYGAAPQRGFSKRTWVVVLLVFLAIHVGILLGYRSYVARRNRAAAQAPPPQPVPVVEVPIIVATPPKPSTLPATAPATAPAVAGLDEVIHQNVGLLLVLGHYEGRVANQRLQVDLPIASGTAFAVSRDGVLLTNKHVVQASNDPKIPKSLQGAGLPTVTLRSTSLLVCFGPDPADHLVATQLFKSDQFDLAVLRTDRTFAAPMKLDFAGPKLGQEVFAVGYPGVIQDLFNEKYASDARLRETIQKLVSTGHVDFFAETFSPESFKATLSYGHISTAERNIDDVGYTQFDAKVSHGNSGGPLIDSSGSVLAIVSLGSQGEAMGYNFGLLLEQLRNELSPYVSMR